MMDTDSLTVESIDGTDDTNTHKSSTKKLKRGRRTDNSENTDSIVENGDKSKSESSSSKLPKQIETNNVTESTIQTSTEEISGRHSHRSFKQLTPLQSFHSNSQNYQQIELTAVSDDDDDDSQDQRKQTQDIPPANHIITDHDTMVSSFATSGDNDVIEIHEFSLADIDAYLDIYFETINNRLTHYIGSTEQVQQFRVAMKTRINSDVNSREYHNVLLGKMNGDVVAAVTLLFPSETTTITNDNILQQSTSCTTSVRRWMIRNANYTPTNIAECYIEMIGVKSAFRNHGIGAAMLECIEHFARQAGAHLLTIHINSDQLRNYFQRSGFDADHSDNSAFWKWIVERQNILKLSKIIPPDDGNNENPMDNTNSYLNGSMVDSEG